MPMRYVEYNYVPQRTAEVNTDVSAATGYISPSTVFSSPLVWIAIGVFIAYAIFKYFFHKKEKAAGYTVYEEILRRDLHFKLEGLGTSFPLLNMPHLYYGAVPVGRIKRIVEAYRIVEEKNSQKRVDYYIFEVMRGPFKTHYYVIPKDKVRISPDRTVYFIEGAQLDNFGPVWIALDSGIKKMVEEVAHKYAIEDVLGNLPLIATRAVYLNPYVASKIEMMETWAEIEEQKYRAKTRRAE